MKYPESYCAGTLIGVIITQGATIKFLADYIDDELYTPKELADRIKDAIQTMEDAVDECEDILAESYKLRSSHYPVTPSNTP